MQIAAAKAASMIGSAAALPMLLMAGEAAAESYADIAFGVISKHWLNETAKRNPVWATQQQWPCICNSSARDLVVSRQSSTTRTRNPEPGAWRIGDSGPSVVIGPSSGNLATR